MIEGKVVLDLLKKKKEAEFKAYGERLLTASKKLSMTMNLKRNSK